MPPGTTIASACCGSYKNATKGKTNDCVVNGKDESWF
jgi:hypothetical protein